MKEDIRNRKDVKLLVSRFYGKVRKNEEIGHIFNNTIRDWDCHMEKLTDFWESNLFWVSTYSGNPQKVHIDVDAANNHQINEKHFGVWLNLWIQTLDENFKGELAQRAKNNARKMATHLHMKMVQARK